MTEQDAAYTKQQLWTAALNAQRLVTEVIACLDRDWSDAKKLAVLAAVVQPFRTNQKGTNGQDEKARAG